MQKGLLSGKKPVEPKVVKATVVIGAAENGNQAHGDAAEQAEAERPSS